MRAAHPEHAVIAAAAATANPMRTRPMVRLPETDYRSQTAPAGPRQPSARAGLTVPHAVPSRRSRFATSEASVGGDLYEIIPTSHGIQAVIADVCGNGLDAILLARHTIVNCGHLPLLSHHGELRPLTDENCRPALGLGDDFTAFTVSWPPGDRLLLCTVGLVESRNRNGDFFTEQEIAAALTAADCDQALDTLMTAVHRHTGGHGHDDIALLLLEHGTYPRSSANRHPAPARAGAETAPPLDRLARGVTASPSDSPVPRCGEMPW
jgi:hypothetical protein